MFLLVERFQVTGGRGEEGLTNKPDTKQLFNTRNFNVSWKDMYGAMVCYGREYEHFTKNFE